MNTEQLEMLRLSAQFPDDDKNATIRAADLHQLLDSHKELEVKLKSTEGRIQRMLASTQPILVTNAHIKKPG
jgi:hypothetical protein